MRALEAPLRQQRRPCLAVAAPQCCLERQGRAAAVRRAAPALADACAARPTAAAPAAGRATVRSGRGSVVLHAAAPPATSTASVAAPAQVGGWVGGWERRVVELWRVDCARLRLLGRRKVPPLP